MYNNRKFNVKFLNNISIIRVNDKESNIKIKKNIFYLKTYHEVDCINEYISVIIPKLTEEFNLSKSEIKEYTETLRIILKD